MRRTVPFVVAFLSATSALAQGVGMGPLPGPGLVQQQGQPPPVSAFPTDVLREPEDQMRAKGLKECKVGDRVLASHEGRWMSAQVIEVTEGAQHPCKVHLIGRPPTSDTSFSAWMLRPEIERP